MEDEMQEIIDNLKDGVLYFKRMYVLQLKGWSFEPISMYDGEGVEGWEWVSPLGEIVCESGGWSDLVAIPNRVEEVADDLIKYKNL